MIEEVGALVHFLSPDFNPIEERVKAEMKNMEISMPDVLDIETIALSAFASITPRGWILNNSIYTQ